MTRATTSDTPRRSIRQRLVLGNTAIALLLILAGLIVVWQVDRLNSAVNDLQTARDRATAALNVRQDSTQLMATISRLLPLEDSAAFQEQVGRDLDSLKASHLDLADLTANTAKNDAAYSLMESVNQSIGNVIGIADTMVRQAAAEQWPSVSIRVGVLTRDHQQLLNETDALVSLTEEIEATRSIQVVSARRTMVLYPAIAVGLSILLGIGLTWRTVRSIAIPVERLTEGASHLAAGALEERVSIYSEDELGQLAGAFNQMAERLQMFYEDLEQRVKERTAEIQRRSIQMATAAHVARDAAAMLEPQELLTNVVNLISEQFKFYHAGIFLIDSAGEYAVLQAANSEGGQRMLVRGHKLKTGQVGLVGYVAAAGEPRIALDVGEDAVYFDNPDLPDTHSEMALPLKVQDQVIGVLDVQSTQAQAFTQEDVEILQILADQIALAIKNAQLLQESQQALQNMEALYGQQARQSWRMHQEILAYSYNRVRIEPVPVRQLSEFEQNERTLSLPITFREQVLGHIYLKREEEQEPWSQEDIILADQAVSQIALALENARLLQEAQRLASREQQINLISTKVRSSTHAETILQNTIRELGRTLGTSRTFIQLGSLSEEEDKERQHG
jgi:GAF domain-containing protein